MRAQSGGGEAFTNALSPWADMAKLTKATLREGLDALAAVDRDVEAALAAHGYPALRRRPQGFPALLRIIVGQQVSVQAAATIWERFAAAVDAEDPDSVLAADEATLRGAGLSRQKAAYVRALAEDVASGRVALRRIPRMNDEEAIAELVKIKGIGRWSAEIYLLFALGRRDVWPADDLAVMVAMQRLKGLEDRPDRKTMDALAEPWRPWRGAGAHFLWHYYRASDPRNAQSGVPV